MLKDLNKFILIFLLITNISSYCSEITDINDNLNEELNEFTAINKLIKAFEDKNQKKWGEISKSSEELQDLLIKDLDDFINKGGDINEPLQHNGNLLHYVIYKKFIRVLKFIIAKKIDLTLCDLNNLPPLISAIVFTNNFEIVEILLQAGADIAAVDKDDKTVLDYCKDEKIRKLILTYKEKK